MGKSSGGGDQNVTQQVVPWSGAQPGLKKAYEAAGTLYDQGGPQYYPGQTYTSVDPLQTYGKELELAYAQQSLPGQFSGLLGAQQQMLSAPDVANNPYVGGVADVISKRLGRQFTEQMNPAIRSNAVAAGGLGGSRQGIAQGIAARGVSEATGDALARLYSDAYGQGLEQQYRGAALAPTVMQTGLIPMQITGDVGAFRRGISDQALQSDIQRWNALQEQPQANLDRYLARLNNAPWGSSKQSSMSGGNAISDLVGLGSLGLGAYNSGLFGAGLGAAGLGGGVAGASSLLGPLSFGTGAAAGAATLPGTASALSSLAMFSDRALKKNIDFVGEKDGYRWYEFEYIDPAHGEGRQIGVMADEVEKVNPDAVITLPTGYKMVDYGAL